MAACFCEWEDKILLLKRHPDDQHGETWCAPGGGIEPGEKPINAVARELLEETGILVEVGQLESLGILYIRLPETRYTFHMFRTHFDTKPEVAVSLEESTEAQWITIEEASNFHSSPQGTKHWNIINVSENKRNSPLRH